MIARAYTFAGPRFPFRAPEQGDGNNQRERAWSNATSVHGFTERFGREGGGYTGACLTFRGNPDDHGTAFIQDGLAQAGGGVA